MAGTVLLACSTGGRSGGPSTRAPSAGPSAAAVQRYLDAVNRLCDDLLPKVIKVTGGGSFDISRRAFFAQLPEHSRLRADFDRALARIPVPPAARNEKRVLDAYIRFANRLDAKRLHAARAGPAPYAREIRAEKRYAGDDPRIAARRAAGFSDSCNAR